MIRFTALAAAATSTLLQGMLLPNGLLISR